MCVVVLLYDRTAKSLGVVCMCASIRSKVPSKQSLAAGESRSPKRDTSRLPLGARKTAVRRRQRPWCRERWWSVAGVLHTEAHFRLLLVVPLRLHQRQKFISPGVYFSYESLRKKKTHEEMSSRNRGDCPSARIGIARRARHVELKVVRQHEGASSAHA